MAGKKVRVHMKKSSEVHVRFPFLFIRTLTDYKGGSGVVSITCLFDFPKSTIVDLVRLYFSLARKKVLCPVLMLLIESMHKLW